MSSAQSLQSRREGVDGVALRHILQCLCGNGLYDGQSVLEAVAQFLVEDALLVFGADLAEGSVSAVGDPPGEFYFVPGPYPCPAVMGEQNADELATFDDRHFQQRAHVVSQIV